MAALDYHKGSDEVVQQLNELFGDKLNLDIIKKIAKSCQFDVHQSSNELLELSNSDPTEHNNRASYMIRNVSPVTISKKSKKAIEIERTIREINDGYKVLIILRGLPGSGKSALAKSILQKTIGYSTDIANKHILSTDDFFMKNGVYLYDAVRLSEAHGWNHQRAFNVMSKGYSPVIIDNTNTQMWEMKPYAMMATDYGYILEILEPDTHWCFNDNELEKRNVHGVSKASIKNMLVRYHKNVTPMKLLTAYDCKYKLQKPPQYRLHPPLPQITSDSTYTPHCNAVTKFGTLPQTFTCIDKVSGTETKNFMDFYDPINTRLTKSQNEFAAQSTSIDDILMHNDSSILKAPVLKPMHTTKIKQSSSLFDSMNAWGVDEQALRSWDLVTPVEDIAGQFITNTIVIDDDDDDEGVSTRDMSTSTDDHDFYILRNLLVIPPPANLKVINTCNRDINRNNNSSRPQKRKRKLMIDKSCLAEEFLDDCNAHLENLTRVFPNMSPKIIKYWFEKCNRDFDCTLELLLHEKDEVINLIIDEESHKPHKEIETITVDSDSSSSSETAEAPRSVKHMRKNNSCLSDETQNLRRYIESKVTISDDHYSEKLLRIKQLKYGESSNHVRPEPESVKVLYGESSNNVTTKPESVKVSNLPVEMEEDDTKLDIDDIEDADNNEQGDNIETVELNLGDNFVKKLEDLFGDPSLLYPKGFQPVIQVPVTLARQLYTFYIESVYQQMDAQNSVMDSLIKEDEAFARKLQETEEGALNAQSEKPRPNTEPVEIPDIMRDQRKLSKLQREADKWKEDTPDTLAARLTREKLFNAFPSIDKDTLVEILHAHENAYNDTLDTLLASTIPENVKGDIEEIKRPPINAEIVKEMWEAHKSCENEAEQEVARPAIGYREEANRYLEKRTKLYELAQKYYQKGMTEVAQFYSGLASKQTNLYEYANSLAATAFLDEHSKRLEDFNTLDLHFLYVKEAVPYLDIFIDRNINLLRLSTSKSTQCLQIITGRGKNSANGVAKIRPAVITRLKDRKISYQQLNPGLIKIKIRNTSKVTSEL